MCIRDRLQATEINFCRGSYGNGREKVCRVSIFHCTGNEDIRRLFRVDRTSLDKFPDDRCSKNVLAGFHIDDENGVESGDFRRRTQTMR